MSSSVSYISIVSVIAIEEEHTKHYATLLTKPAMTDTANRPNTSPAPALIGSLHTVCPK